MSIINKAGLFIGKKIVYYQSATKYVSIINFLLILATFKATYNLQISAPIIIVAGLITAMLIGIIDYRYIMKHQIAYANENNNILKELRELRRELQESKKL